MRTSVTIRVIITGLLALALVLPGMQAKCQSFNEMLGEFRQAGSGVCVIYGHVLAMAEYDPVGFTQMFKSYPDGWLVKLHKHPTFVARAEVEKSIANGFSVGEPDNLLTIASLAISKRSGGYNPATGMLDYGPKEYGQFIGSGKWTLYDNDQTEPNRTISDGFERLIRETNPDGTLKTPSTMGFGNIEEQTSSELSEQAKKCKLVGGHDFSVSRYDAEKKVVILRNPHNPKELLETPVELLKQIPAGIDFMEQVSSVKLKVMSDE